MRNFRNYKQQLGLTFNRKKVAGGIIAFFRKPFIRNVVIVISGTALAQIVTTLFSPILTRIYGPESMGLYGTFTSVLSIAAPISALTFPIAIVLVKEDEEAKALAYLSMFVSVLMAALTFIGLFFFGDIISRFLQVQVLRPYLLLVPVVMLFSAMVEILNQWFIRKRTFNLAARAGVFHALITNFLKLFLGLIAPTAASLVIVTTVGTGLNGILLLLGTGVLSFASLKRLSHIRLSKEMIQIGKKYREFPLYRTPQAFVNAVSLNLPILMLTTLFGPVAAGFYALGNKVLLLPVNLIGDSVGNVFYPRFSQAYHEGEDTSKLLILATLALAGIGIIPFAIIIYFGPAMFGWIFGQDWVTAGVYTRWIGLWVFTTFISRPAIKALPVVGAQKFHLVHTIVSIVCKSGLLLVGAVVFKNDVIAVALYGLSGSILNILLIVVTVYKSRSVHQLN